MVYDVILFNSGAWCYFVCVWDFRVSVRLPLVPSAGKLVENS